MHVISGLYKGKKLDVLSKIRPTMGKVREALFNIIIHSPIFEKNIDEIKFLDLFCGSGSIGIEAISIGITNVTMIDIDTTSATHNINRLNLQKKISILDRDILKLRNASDKFNIIFMDPPYCNDEILKGTLENLKKYNWIEDKCMLIIESKKNENICFDCNDFKLIESRKYGISKLTILSFIGAKSNACF
jgi:16S rRNA (guanine966-N2)-methyltransferase